MPDKPICIIPARGGSKRFPRKNLALLNGKPLLAYAIEAALESRLFEEVMVSTEDREIAQVACSFGATVPFLRAAEYAADSARIIHVCLSTLDMLEARGLLYEILCVLQPTCPLRTAADIWDAWQLFLDSRAPFLVSVTDFDHPPFWALRHNPDGSLTPFWGREFMQRSQELPQVVRPNGAIAIARVDDLREAKSFYGPGLVGYHMPRWRSVDVDEPQDILFIETLIETGSVDFDQGIKANEVSS